MESTQQQCILNQTQQILNHMESATLWRDLGAYGTPMSCLPLPQGAMGWGDSGEVGLSFSFAYHPDHRDQQAPCCL